MNRHLLMASVVLALHVRAAEEPPAQLATDRIERVAVDAQAGGALTMEVFLAESVSQGDRVSASFAYDTNNVVTFGSDFDLTALTESGYSVVLTNVLAGVTNWSAESPTTYDLVVRLEQAGTLLHSVTQRVGFRSVEVRDGAGLIINGSRVLLKGCVYNPFVARPGAEATAKTSAQDVALMKRMNMNAVRVTTSPSAHFLAECDRQGLYVIDDSGAQPQPDRPAIGFGLAAPFDAAAQHPSRIVFAADALKKVSNPTYAELKDVLKEKSPLLVSDCLHALGDGGGGAGLHEYWRSVAASKAGVGLFIWRFADEALVRTGETEVAATASDEWSADGIVGPNREKEGSFYAIRDAFSPVRYVAVSPDGRYSHPPRFVNAYDFTDLTNVLFSWAYLKLPAAKEAAKGVGVVLSETMGATNTLPGGILDLYLPGRDHAPEADAVRITAKDWSGRQLNTWTWKFVAADTLNPLPVERRDLTTEIKEEGEFIRTSIGEDEYRVRRSDGSLDSIKLSGGTINFSGFGCVVGDSKLTNIIGNAGYDRSIVEAWYEGALRKLVWTPLPGGWVQLAYEYVPATSGVAGVSLGYPASKIKSVRWLGDGPYRVWQNRMRGGSLGIWTNGFNDTATGESWAYPESRGFFGPWLWVRLETEDGFLTVANQTDATFLGLYNPRALKDAGTTALELPAFDIGFFHAIPAIGSGKLPAADLGPKSQPAKLKGAQRGAVLLRFEPAKPAP